MKQVYYWLTSKLSPMTIIQQRFIHSTCINYSAPLRKKKVINPLTHKKQFERKVRKLEKEIKRLEAIPPKLIPILELQLPPKVIKELDDRKRKDVKTIDDKIINQYNKVWAIYRQIESNQEMKYIKKVASTQDKALNLLKNNYPDLYQEAIQLDPNLIPFKIEIVKKHTPPIASYKCPDGKATDITKEWKL